MAQEHDRRYKYVFSHPAFVERLLTSFVDEPFVDDLDFSTLQRVNASFVSEEFARREADVIWKLSYRGRPIYLFVLIEFQSSVDPWMALRFLRYLAEFYQSLVAEGQSAPLPAVFPLLLYTGDPKWSAVKSVEELIQPELPRSFIPQLSYYAILVNEMPKETLLRIHNAVSAVFYVENSDPDKLAETLDELMAILSEEAAEQFEVFGRWVANYLAGTPGEGAVTGPIRSAGELRTMFATKLQQYGERLKEEARYEEKRETARALKEQGVAVEVIARATGLSEEEIRAL